MVTKRGKNRYDACVSAVVLYDVILDATSAT